MSSNVRPSVIAGTWYPGTRDKLQETIEGYFNKVQDRNIEGEIMGLISPHAGYLYSGQVAAYGYKQVTGKNYDVVVIVSPLHHVPTGRYIVNSASYYETPLGRVPVDSKLVQQIASKVELTIVSEDNEHSLEIQLPFLQVALGNFTLIPIMVGSGDVYGCEDLVDAFVNVLNRKRFLMVASTDLHHIENYNEVVKKDKVVVDKLTGFNLKEIREVLNQFDCTVCGRVPVSIVLDAVKKMGANKLVALSQMNSGEVTGEKSPGVYTVGYVSAAIVKV